MGKKFRRQDGWSGIKTRHFATIDWVNSLMLDYALLSGDNVFTGNNTFNNPVTIPDGVAPTDAASYGQISGFTVAIGNNAIDIVDIKAAREEYWQYIPYETNQSQAYMYDHTYSSCICKANINVLPLSNTIVKEFYSGLMPGGLGLGTIDYSCVYEFMHLGNNITTVVYDDFVFNPNLKFLFLNKVETTPGYDLRPLTSLNTYTLGYITCSTILGVPQASNIEIYSCSNLDFSEVNSAQAFSQLPIDSLYVEDTNATSIDISNQVFNGGTAQCAIVFNTALTNIICGNNTVGSGCISFDFSGNALQVASVDDILSKVNMFAGMIPNGTLNLSGGTNAAPTGGATNTDIVALQGNGWTVNYN